MSVFTERLRDDIFAAAETPLCNQRGEPVKLSDFRGRNLVVYFYPRDDTPGCTIEGREFAEMNDQFDALDTTIVGVSIDSAESHRAFAEKHALPFVLLSDPEGKLINAFGVMRDGAAERATFVIDREGRVRRSFRNVKPRGHAREVLNFIRSMLESHRMIGG
jgi:peroxiredoxin Q/BCP